METKKQSSLADQMLDFLSSTPLPPDLQWSKDRDFLFHFEAARHLIICQMLESAGITREKEIRVLDFGYLHGLTQEFLHRAFPRAAITVCDVPSSPIFGDAQYMASIEQRGYVKLIPCDIKDVGKLRDTFDVIILGEVIEHFDPTTTARALDDLKRITKPGGLLVVTTPNAAGLYNCWMTLRQRDIIQVAPLPNKTFGLGHIHLWSLRLLRETAEYFGWEFKEAQFYHGREAEKFEEIRSAWVGLNAQITIRLLRFLTNRNPAWRGFFVALFRG